MQKSRQDVEKSNLDSYNDPLSIHYVRFGTTFHVFVNSPTRNDIDHVLLFSSSYCSMRPLGSRHVDMIDFDVLQVTSTPTSLVGSCILVGSRYSSQNIWCQVLNGIPQGLTIPHPRQVGVKAVGPSNALPHDALVIKFVRKFAIK